MARTADASLIGRTIAGKFLVESPIGNGAMGAVYRARQIALDKTIAIKVLHGEHADDPTFAARFQREAKAASRLNHPNSMQVIDFGEEPDGLLYIAMEYLDGRSLHRVLYEEGPLSPARVADILMQTLAALAVAHDMGVVHRDLKPENIVILRGTDDDGRAKDMVKVCDFGIAKITDSRAYRGTPERESGAPVTTSGFLIGTPEYMSPEQARGDKLDARSDLYSVGVLLFEMLVGRVPFEAESAIGVVLKHITEEAPRPSSRAPAVEPRLEAICLRALRKAREARYQSAREMRAELRAVAEYRDPVSSVPGIAGVAAVSGAPAASSATSAPDVQLGAAEPAIGHAATVRISAGDTLARTSDDGLPKPTLTGTSAPIGRKQGRLTQVAAAAALTGVVAAVAVIAFMARGNRAGAPGSVATLDPAAGSAAPTVLEPSEVDDEVPPLESASAGGLVRHPPGARGSHAAGAGSSRPPASKDAPSSVAAVVTAATAASSPLAVVAPPAATDTTAAPQADPTWDLARAYVEIGLVNAQGVREPAVRAALHGVGFSSCYKAALKTRGARATGVATLNLSIDENGLGRSAIVTGASFLPGLPGCLQGAASGVRVPKSQVDSGGGTAEVTLAFKSP
jgi:eukaryotic-like serine/threonine-protein kinase